MTNKIPEISPQIHQILVITVILMFVSVHSKHCTLDAMRNWAEEACENLRGIEFRERRHICKYEMEQRI